MAHGATGNRAPVWWLAVTDPLLHCSREELNSCVRDRNGLPSINLLQVLNTSSGEFNDVGRIKGKVATKLLGHAAADRTTTIIAGDNKR